MALILLDQLVHVALVLRRIGGRGIPRLGLGFGRAEGLERVVQLLLVSQHLLPDPRVTRTRYQS